MFDANAGACSLDSITAKVGARIEELVSNVDRFTATEAMEHTALSPLGLQMSYETRQFNYLVEIRKSGERDLDVQEYRDGSVSVQQFPAHLGTIGLPTLVLVFHPYYQPKYDFKCEGGGSWNGRKTWVVHFQQKANSHSEMLVYHVNGRFYPVGLKGRAWIDSGHVANSGDGVGYDQTGARDSIDAGSPVDRVRTGSLCECGHEDVATQECGLVLQHLRPSLPPAAFVQQLPAVFRRRFTKDR